MLQIKKVVLTEIENRYTELEDSLCVGVFVCVCVLTLTTYPIDNHKDSDIVA